MSVIGGISGVSSVPSYERIPRTYEVQTRAAEKTERSAVVYASARALPLETPVQPVEPIKPVNRNVSGTLESVFLRQGADPAELAVRMRMQYVDVSTGEVRLALEEDQKAEQEELEKTEEVTDKTETKSAREIMEEGECQTCEERKYQDGSDDLGVSFKTPGHIDADVAGSVVRGHEMEHVNREQAKAKLESREVLRQSVILHNAICPECGKVYVSGGTTRTVTAQMQKPQNVEEDTLYPQLGFDVVA